MDVLTKSSEGSTKVSGVGEKDTGSDEPVNKDTHSSVDEPMDSTAEPGDQPGDKIYTENALGTEDESDEEDDVQITIGEFKANVNFRQPQKGGFPGAQGAKSQSAKIDMDAVASVGDKTVFDTEFDQIAEKPWRQPGADITDYFNYGFTEETFSIYCDRQRRLRGEFGAQANKVLFAGSGSLNIMTDAMRSKIQQAQMIHQLQQAPPPSLPRPPIQHIHHLNPAPLAGNVIPTVNIMDSINASREAAAAAAASAVEPQQSATTAAQPLPPPPQQVPPNQPPPNMESQQAPPTPNTPTAPDGPTIKTEADELEGAGPGEGHPIPAVGAVTGIPVLAGPPHSFAVHGQHHPGQPLPVLIRGPPLGTVVVSGGGPHPIVTSHGGAIPVFTSQSGDPRHLVPNMALPPPMSQLPPQPRMMSMPPPGFPPPGHPGAMGQPNQGPPPGFPGGMPPQGATIVITRPPHHQQINIQGAPAGLLPTPGGVPGGPLPQPPGVQIGGVGPPPASRYSADNMRFIEGPVHPPVGYVNPNFPPPRPGLIATGQPIPVAQPQRQFVAAGIPPTGRPPWDQGGMVPAERFDHEASPASYSDKSSDMEDRESNMRPPPERREYHARDPRMDHKRDRDSRAMRSDRPPTYREVPSSSGSNRRTARTGTDYGASGSSRSSHRNRSRSPHETSRSTYRRDGSEGGGDEMSHSKKDRSEETREKSHEKSAEKRKKKKRVKDEPGDGLEESGDKASSDAHRSSSSHHHHHRSSRSSKTSSSKQSRSERDRTSGGDEGSSSRKKHRKEGHHSSSSSRKTPAAAEPGGAPPPEDGETSSQDSTQATVPGEPAVKEEPKD